MTKYPLTYAVFYRSLIEPFTQSNQYDINHILLAGNIDVTETHPDYISRVLGNGYVSGNKTIRKVFTKRIALLTPSELVPRIKRLALQDIPLVVTTAKKLIQISDISLELQHQLLEKADTIDSELFLAELFQLSLRCHNQKLKIDAEHRKYLSALAMDKSKSELPQKELDPKDLLSVSIDSLLEHTQTNSKDQKDKAEKLLEHYYEQYKIQKLDAEEKDYATWRRINLPEDMERL